ncbi:lysophospholipid acyltransferase family protein [bacterium]|nr:lysophospholipid acyltransferase family protein [bacterium]
MAKAPPAIAIRNSLIHGLTYLLLALVRILPEQAAYGIGRNLALLAWWTMPNWRRNCDKNMRLFFRNDPLGQPEAAAQRRDFARRAAINLGYTVIEFMRLGLLEKEKGLAMIVEDDGSTVMREAMEEARRRGTGVIALSMHYGNWEAIGAFISSNIGTLYAVGKQQSDDFFTNLAFPWRSKYGIKNIYSGPKANAGILRALAEGSILGLLADQNGGRAGTFAPFAGIMSSTPAGPGALALRTGCPLVLCYCDRIGPGRLRFKARLAFEINEAAGLPEDKDAALVEVLTRMNRVLEQVIRDDPSQWLWGPKRWKTRPPGEPSLY